VYSREILAMNLAGQLARLPADQGLEKVAENKTARLLKVGLAQLSRLRKVDNPEVKPREDAKAQVVEIKGEEPPAPDEATPS